MAVMHPTVAAAVEAARAAGEIAMKYYRGGFEVTIKPDKTPVTQADQEAEKAIRAILARATPGCGFLGEELGQEGPTSRRPRQGAGRCSPCAGTATDPSVPARTERRLASTSARSSIWTATAATKSWRRTPSPATSSS